MHRPDLTPLAWVHADCQHSRCPGQGHLTIGKVYGQDGLRLLRCGRGQEAFAERRPTALFHTTGSAAKAEALIDQLDAGGSVRAPARLTQAAQATVARVLKTRGRPAQRCHAHEVKDRRPGAIQCDEHWSWVKKQPKNGAPEEVQPAGDVWDPTAVAPDSKVSGSFVGGTRTHEQTQAVVSETPSRWPKGPVPALCSAGSEGDEPSSLAALGRREAAPQTGFVGRPRRDLIRGPPG